MLERFLDETDGKERIEDIRQDVMEEIQRMDRVKIETEEREKRYKIRFDGLSNNQISKATSMMYCWKSQGLDATDAQLNQIFKRYFQTTNCELCKKPFSRTVKPVMEHNHFTGEFRSVCCHVCNRPSNNPYDFDAIHNGYRFGLYINKGNDLFIILWDKIEKKWIKEIGKDEFERQKLKRRATKQMPFEDAKEIVTYIFVNLIHPKIPLIPLS